MPKASMDTEPAMRSTSSLLTVTCCILSLSALAAHPVVAGTADYVYDVHGRLVVVAHDTGSSVTYVHDGAGNRTQVITSIAPPVPASLSVPASSTTGSYTVSWSPSAANVIYELYEATSSAFSGQMQAFSGSATSAALSGRVEGTYYYRVRACNAQACSGYRVGSNAITVALPPGTPSSINVPASSHSGSYAIGWGGASGAVHAYELYEATNSGFSGQVRVYAGTALTTAFSGRGNGSYYYRVRACNANGCGGYRAGDNGVSVNLVPPAPPASIAASGQPRQGNYSISWSTSSGANRYELWESVYGGSYYKVYDGFDVYCTFLRSSGEYRYRAKACNAAGCSDFSPIRFVMVCNPYCQ